VRQRIPPVRASLCRCIPRLKREKPAHRLVVAEDRRSINVAVCNLGVLS
jgi:hypothetical protein